MKLDVRASGSTAWTITLRRPNHLIALRRAAARAVAAGSASLQIPRGQEDAEPVVWEDTDLVTLATERGLIRLGAAPAGARAPSVHLGLAEPPRSAAAALAGRHPCVSHEDGAGGFTVLCRVNPGASAANVTAADPREDVWIVPIAEDTLVRLDLPASSRAVEARVLGYTDGDRGVVVRVERSLVAGEDRPSLAVLAAERPQPILPRPRHWRGRWVDFDL